MLSVQKQMDSKRIIVKNNELVYQIGYHLLSLQVIKIIGYGDCKRKRFQSQPD